jgi:primase-polymerase (primpol)-like protein
MRFNLYNGSPKTGFLYGDNYMSVNRQEVNIEIRFIEKGQISTSSNEIIKILESYKEVNK